MTISRRMLLAGVAAGLLAGASGCGNMFASTIRYRVTVELNTPWGVRSGSSIVESIIREGPNTGNGGLNYGLRGEAVAITLPSGTFFALLGRVGQGNGEDYFANILPRAIQRRQSQPPMSSSFSREGWRAQRAEAREKRATFTLEEPDYPSFAAFRDIRDPRSAIEISSENIESIFGKGVSVKKITLQVTDESPSSRIKSIIPWVVKVGSGYLNGQRLGSADSPFSGKIGASSFSAGVN